MKPNGCYFYLNYREVHRQPFYKGESEKEIKEKNE